MITDKYVEVVTFLVKNRRIPPSFVLKNITAPITQDNIKNISAGIQHEYKEKIKMYISTPELRGKSIILTGYDSLIKDEIALCILIWYASQNKKVCYYSSPIEDIEANAYVTAIMRVDTICDFKQKGKLQNLLISAITDNKIVVLSTTSIESLTTALGESISQLILTKPFVHIDIPKQKITGIRL